MNALKTKIQQLLHCFGYKLVNLQHSPVITNRKIYEAVATVSEPWVILDIGANIGQSCREFAKEFPGSQIYAFEPFEDNFMKLQKLSSPNIHTFPLAISDVSGPIEIWRDNRPTSEWNSLEEYHQKRLSDDKSAKRVVIVRERLDTWCEKYSINHIQILKIDTEGHEMAVLASCRDLLLDGSIEFVVAEVGFEQNTAHTPFSTLYDYLTKARFHFVGTFESAYKANGVCEYANAVFALSRPDTK